MSAAAILAGFRAIRTAQGVDAVYGRGTDSLAVTVVLGQSDHDVADAHGVVTTWQSRDVMLEASQLILAGERREPARGDTVRLTFDGVDTVWRVQFPDPNRPPFKFSDPYRQILRVHTAHTETVIP